MAIIRETLVEDIIILLKIGKIKATSTSKIKNKTTNRKKRVENGARILLKGSKPHSNVETSTSQYIPVQSSTFQYCPLQPSTAQESPVQLSTA